MAYSRFSRRRSNARRPRIFGGYRPRRYSRYSRPSYRVGIYRRRPVRRTAYQRRSRRVQSSGMNCCNSNQLDPGQKFILAQADPFEPKAFGGKIPDSSTIPSIATPLQYNFSLTSTTAATDKPSNAHAWAFYPHMVNCNITAIGLSASTWGWGAGTTLSSATQASKYQAAFEAFRPTAHAIRLSCPFAPTSTTGFVHIALATETVFGSSTPSSNPYVNLATNFGDMSGYTFYKRVTLASLTQSPLTLVNKWTDETAFRYQSPFADPSVASNSNTSMANQFHIPLSWGVLLVAVEGVSTDNTLAASITPLQAEIILHTEGIPDKAGTLVGSTAAAYDSGTLNAVSQAQASSDFAHTEAQQESHMSQFMSTVADAAGNSPTIRQLARSVGNGIVNAAMNAVMGAAGLPGVNAEPNRLLIH